MIDLKKIDKLNKLRNKAEMLQLKTQEAFHKWQDYLNRFRAARDEVDKMEKEIFPTDGRPCLD
jgi:hypothetical protein